MKRKAVVIAAALSGCVSGIPVRTAEVAGRGEVAVLINVTVAAYAPGRVRSGEHSIAGNGAGRAPLFGPLIFGVHFTDADVTVSRGVGGGCEVGGRVSLVRAGVELRCTVLDERDGDAVSMAGSIEGAVPWLIGAPGVVWPRLDPWLRIGVESSGNHGAVTPLAGLHVTWGTEVHSLSLPDTVAPGRFEGPGAQARVSRRELRLSAVVGAGATTDGGTGLLLAVVPYRILHAGRASVACDACGKDLVLDDWDHRQGFSVVAGIAP